MTSFVVLDTETTGLNLREDTIVEIAIVRLLEDGTVSRDSFSSLVNPKRPIPPGASEVHHITDADVSGAPILEEIAPTVRAFVGLSTIIAHNAPFDRALCEPVGLPNPWLCNLRLARHVWPRAPRHSIQALKEWLKLDVDAGGLAAHRALADTLVTAAVFARARQIYSEQHPGASDTDLLAYVNSPIVVELMPFGKHKGLPLREMPADYVRWALQNISDLDPDLRQSLKSAHNIR